MQQAMTGFIQDELGDWVALLQCGHRQHVRHLPPWQNRPWVQDAATRAGKIGQLLNCKECEIETVLPAMPRKRVAIVGGGPAGLMAAEYLSSAGDVQVDVFDAMPTMGRKFLLAGVGGLNLTHAEDKVLFVNRYAERCAEVEVWLEEFDAQALRAWAQGLGVETFVGSSGRVFPVGMKAAPLLRAWLKRLRSRQVGLHVRHRFSSFKTLENQQIALTLHSPEGELNCVADAVIFAMGGASWARLGSDGAWAVPFAQHDISLVPFQPANCGFTVAWSEYFIEKFAGSPLKNIAIFHPVTQEWRVGECILSAKGLEGSLIYALSAPLRNQLITTGTSVVQMDLLPHKSLQQVLEAVSHPRGTRSLSSHLQSRCGLTGVKMALLRECLPLTALNQPAALAQFIKSLPIPLQQTYAMDKAISTAGGVSFDALDSGLMLKNHRGIFCAGEMLDWEAPTGGYLLTACLASGRFSAKIVLDLLKNKY